jgi:hypothetical protein
VRLDVKALTKKSLSDLVTGESFWSELATLACGAVTVGELDVTNVSDMVGQLEGLCRKERGVISRLSVIDHGRLEGNADGSNAEYVIRIGESTVQTGTMYLHYRFFRQIGALLADRGFVHFWHCWAGQNVELLKVIAEAVGKPVYAGTVRHNPVFNFNWGGYVCVAPDGTVTRDTARPIPWIESEP